MRTEQEMTLLNRITTLVELLRASRDEMYDLYFYSWLKENSGLTDKEMLEAGIFDKTTIEKFKKGENA